MRKATRNRIVFAVAIIALVALLGMVTQGFQKWKISDVKETVVSKLVKERNPDNLIKEVALESGKDATSDITFSVDKYGRVTLNGTASATSAVTYATVTLSAGTYYLTGDSALSSNSSEYLAIYDSSNNLVARADTRSDPSLDPGEFTATAGTYTIRIVVVEDGIIKNAVVAPVLSTELDTPFFAEH